MKNRSRPRRTTSARRKTGTIRDSKRGRRYGGKEREDERPPGLSAGDYARSVLRGVSGRRVDQRGARTVVGGEPRSRDATDAHLAASLSVRGPTIGCIGACAGTPRSEPGVAAARDGGGEGKRGWRPTPASVDPASSGSLEAGSSARVDLSCPFLPLALSGVPHRRSSTPCPS